MPKEPRMGEVHIDYIQQRRRHVIPAQFMPEDCAYWQYKNERRGQNPVSATRVKRAQLNRRTLAVLLHQQCRDQVAGKDKEDSSAQTGKGPCDRRVIAQLRPVT